MERKILSLLFFLLLFKISISAISNINEDSQRSVIETIIYLQPENFGSPLQPNEDPVAAIGIGDKTCANDTIWFYNQSTGDYTNILWDFGDSIDAVAWENPYHIYSEPGTYNITLTVILENEDGTTIRDQATQELVVNPSPIITYLYDGDSLFNEGQQGKAIEIEAKGEYTSIEWTHSGEASSIISVTKPGTYATIATNDLGCSIETKTQEIIFKAIGPAEDGIIVVNNILTPNNDGFNDFLIIKDLTNYQNPVVLTIYSSWGTKVYETTDYRQVGGWEAKEVDAGTYYYHITTEDMPGKTGYIDVLK